MLNKILFAVAVFPYFLSADLQTLRKDLHFKLYEELTYYPVFGTPDYWISAGKSQAFSDIIIMIDMELIGMSGI